MTKKIHNTGSALLLSLLIVSAFLSSVFYINVFSMRQNNQAKNINNSIIAYYSAEAMNEQAIYRVRNNLYTDILQLNMSMELGNNSSVTRIVADQIDGISIALKKDEFFQFDIFDPDNIIANSNLDHLSFSWQDKCSGKSWIELTSNEWGDEGGGSISWGVDALSQNHIKKTLLNLGDSNLDHIDEIEGIKFNPAKSYQFRVKAMYCDISNLQIKAYSDNEGTNILPFKNIINITSIGEYPKSGQKSNKQALSVNFKKASPLSSLFDYVIFSEKSLVKDIESYEGDWYSEEFYIAEPDVMSMTIGVEYNHDILLVNGSEPYRCELSGNPPPGIELGGCNISGKPGEIGTFPISIRAFSGSGEEEQSVEKKVYILVSKK